MRQHRVWAAPLLVGAAVLLLPATGSAQFRTGNFRAGSFAPAPFYGYYPGYNSYGYSPYSWGYGSPNAYSYSPRSYGYGNAWNSPGYAWGNYSNWGSPGYAPPTVFSSDYYFNPGSTPGYFDRAPGAGETYSYGARAGAGQDNSALLNVRLPDANAQVWVEGDLTRQRGTWREYVSPPLDPNKKYTYDVRARWTENGREVERTRTVPVQANGVATVDFTAAGDNRPRGEDIDRGGKSRPSDSARPPDTTTPPAGTQRPGTTPPGDTRPPDTTKPGGTRPPDRQ
jgi:uncharacterized protein (TIGR03000 family)